MYYHLIQKGKIVKHLLIILFFVAVTMNAQGTKTTAAAVPQKIGYVESEVIFQRYAEAVKAQGEYDAFEKDLYAQLDSLQQDAQQDYADLMKKAEMMKDAQKKEAQGKLQQKLQVIDEFKKTKFDRQSGELVRKQMEVMKPINEKILQAISAVAVEEGLSFVLNKAGDVLVPFADPACDVTNKVLSKLTRGK